MNEPIFSNLNTKAGYCNVTWTSTYSCENTTWGPITSTVNFEPTRAVDSIDWNIVGGTATWISGGEGADSLEDCATKSLPTQPAAPVGVPPRYCATTLSGSFPISVLGSPCCEVPAGTFPPVNSCAKPKARIGGANGFEVVPVGTPLVGGGQAGQSVASLNISSGTMTDRLSVDANGTELTGTTNGNTQANIPTGATSLDIYIVECYEQTGGWVYLPGKQGTNYAGGASWDLFVWATSE